MSATITTLPDGRRLVTCDRCKTQTATPFREVAFKWSREHVCGTPSEGGAA